MVKLDFGCGHGHLFQLSRCPLHEYYRNFPIRLSFPDIFKVVSDSPGGVALAYYVKDIGRVFAYYGKREVRHGYDFSIDITAAHVCLDGINHFAFLVVAHYEGIGKVGFAKRFLYASG